MLAPLIRAVEEKEREVVSTTALKERAMASVDWLPHRAQPMEEEATTTHRVTVATATTAGPGTSHRMYTIGKEMEEGEGRWDGTRQVLMSRGREGHGHRVVPVGMLQVREEVKVHGATVVGMMSSGLVSSLHGEDRVVS